MLVLTRKPNQQIRIGSDIVVTVVKVERNSIRIAIEAPRDVHILRGELERYEDSSPKNLNADGSKETVSESSSSFSPAAAPLAGHRRASQAHRRSLPASPGEADRQSPRSPTHPQRWTIASMRQRTDEGRMSAKPDTSSPSPFRANGR